jgi:antitoxin FitA
VPENIHRILKSRASREGLSLSGFIKRELQIVAQRPTMQEWRNRTRQAKPIPMGQTAAQIIRDLRDER